MPQTPKIDVHTNDLPHDTPTDSTQALIKDTDPATASVRFLDVVSGDYDDLEGLEGGGEMGAGDDLHEGQEGEEGSDEPESLKRVLAAQVESPKLHKVLAQEGLGSRLEMERMMTTLTPCKLHCFADMKVKFLKDRME